MTERMHSRTVIFVSIIRSGRPSACAAMRSATHRSSGLPLIGCSSFRGNRVDSRRQGTMMAVVGMAIPMSPALSSGNAEPGGGAAGF